MATSRTTHRSRSLPSDLWGAGYERLERRREALQAEIDALYPQRHDADVSARMETIGEELDRILGRQMAQEQRATLAVRDVYVQTRRAVLRRLLAARPVRL